MKVVALLGSTGSIGTQTLDVIAANHEEYQVSLLAAYEQDELLEQQIDQFKPAYAVLVNFEAAERLKKRYQGKTVILSGYEGLLEAINNDASTIVLNAMVGFAGLKPTIAAINQGKDIALANKETLVAAGSIVTEMARKHKIHLLPVDSEHSAVFQCLQGEDQSSIEKIILTASGGPFRTFPIEKLQTVTLEDCLKHPNWSMGRKITIDSSTLVNKGLEVIEAHWLFDMPYESIEVLVHPQSIVHSLIETTDGALKAQLGLPDMKVPIQYALTYPHRSRVSYGNLQLSQVNQLTFEKPDIKKFPALKMAYDAGKQGGTYPCVFNAANEAAVHAFIEGRIQYVDIVSLIGQTLEKHKPNYQPDIEVVFAADAWARKQTQEFIGGVFSS